MTFLMRRKSVNRTVLTVLVPILVLLFFGAGMYCSVVRTESGASAASGIASAVDLVLYNGTGEDFGSFTSNTFVVNQDKNLTSTTKDEIRALYQYHKNSASNKVVSANSPDRKTIRSYTAACFSPKASYDASASLVYCNISSASNLTLANATADHRYNGSDVFYTGESVDLSSYLAVSNNGIMYFTQFPDSKSDFSLCATFYLSPFVISALQDSLLTVSITPYIITIADSVDTSGSVHADGVLDTSKDSADISCSYYNPNFENSIGTSPNATTLRVPVGTAYQAGSSLTLAPGNYNDRNGEKAFVQVNLSRFIATADRSIALGEIGLCIEVSPNDSIIFDNSSTYSITGNGYYYDATYVANRYATSTMWQEHCTEFYTQDQKQVQAGTSYRNDTVYNDKNGNNVSSLAAIYNASLAWDYDCTMFYIYDKKTYEYVKLTAHTAFDEGETYYALCTNRNKTEDIRYVSATSTRYASIGSSIDFDIMLRRDAQFVYLEPSLATQNNALCSGIVFKQLFNPNATTTIEFEVTAGEIQELSQSDGSGQNAHLIIKGGNSQNLLVVTVSIGYIDLIDGSKKYMKRQEYTVYVDNDLPPTPTFDKTDSFYSAYFGNNAVYYTGSNNEDIQSMDVVENINIVDEYNYLHLDLTSLNLIKVKNSYEKQYSGSDISVYYRSTYYGDSMPSVQSDKVSKGFSFSVDDVLAQPNEDLLIAPSASNTSGSYIGRYARASQISEEENECELTYGSLRLSMAYYDFSVASTFENGKQYYTKSGKKYVPCNGLTSFASGTVYYVRDQQVSYRKSGVWAIEFVSYDNVGNSVYATTKIFIKVDITQYEFTVNMFLGDTSAEYPETLSSSDFRLSYYILSPSGTLTGGSNKVVITGSTMTLHRGDNVYMVGEYQGSGNTLYSLTALQVGGNTKQSCTDFYFVGKTPVPLTFTNTGTVDFYTFSVSKNFCDKEEYRIVNLFFKNRVSVNAAKKLQQYDGQNKTIAPYATYQGSTLQRITLKSYYYRLLSEQNGDYAVGDAIPFGTVYTVMGSPKTLQQDVFPNTHFITANGTYQEGVYYYVKVDNNGSNVPVHTGTYYVEITIPNDVTYYGCAVVVLQVSAGVPDVSTLYALKGNAAGQKKTIVYGTSLSTIDWSPDTRVNNRQIVNESLYCYYDNDSVSDRSSNGIIGYYKLKFSDKTSLEYTRPSAGTHYIEVEFVPLLGTYNSTTMEVLFEYDENGNFIENTDYTHVSAMIVLNVSPRNQEENISFALTENQGMGELRDNTVYYTYDGTQKTIAFTLTSLFENADGSLRSERGGTPLDLKPQASVYYAKVGTYLTADFDESTLYFDSFAPYTAGLYLVRILLQITDKCNYVGTFDAYLRINKIELQVDLDDQTYDYQYESKPQPTFTDGLGVEMTVGYTYTFFSYTSGSYAAACDTENGKKPLSGEAVRPYVYTPVAAGKYVVRVDVDAENYQGTGYALYTVKTVDDKNNYTVKTWPTVIASTTTDLTYGQPISETRLTSGSGYYVRYTFRSYESETPTETTKSLSGKFFVAYMKYADWCKQTERTDSNNSRTQYYQEMKYYCPDGINTTGYSMFVCFGAFTEKNSIMEFDMNFDFLYNTGINVTVGKALLDWSKVTITPIPYETSVGTVSDVSISKSMGLYYSSNGTTPLGKTADVDYYYRGSDVYVYLSSLGIEYSFSLSMAERKTFDAGKHTVPVRFNITDVNFGSEERSVILTVEKRILTVTIPDNRYTAVYNNYAEDEKLFSSFRYTGGTDLPDLTGNLVYTTDEKTYTKNTDGYSVRYQMGDGEVTDTVAVLPAGTYSVVYTVVNDNYAGVLDSFTLVIEKARLQVKKQPDISDEINTVCYQKNISAVRFNNGEMISASASGETVEGTFTVSSYHVGQTFGYYNTLTTLYWTFTPKDTKNYKTFRGEFTVRQSGTNLTNGEGAPSYNGEGQEIYYDSLNYTLYYWQSGWKEFGTLMTQSAQSKEEQAAAARLASVPYIYRDYTIYAVTKSEVKTVAVMDTEYRCFYDKKVNKVDLSALFSMDIATYAYSAGHESVYGEGNSIALTKDFVKESFSAEGKAIQNYSDYVLEYLDKKIKYKTGFPSDLEGRFTIGIAANVSGGYIGAGSYVVTLSVQDVTDSSDIAYNYCGEYKTYLTVNRQRAYIVLENDDDHDYVVEKVFTAKTQKVSPVVYDALNNKISLYVSQSYYRNGVLVSVPTVIGGYDIRLALGDTRNYMLVTASYDGQNYVLGDSAVSFVSASMRVGVNTDEILFTNLTQTYSQVKNVIIDMGMNDATCSLEYIRVIDGVETGIRYTEAPIGAGEYNVHLVFDPDYNNGYSADIIWSEKLVIEKYNATVVCSSVLTCVYTGKNKEFFTAYTDPYGLSLSYAYKTGDEWQSIEPANIGALDAGTYEILITIEDNNYCGSKQCSLRMEQATGTVKKVPSFGSFVYGSDDDITVPSSTGNVFCNESGESDVVGRFVLSSQTMKGVNVGTKQVLYSFVPDSKNYATLYGYVSVTVLASDISDKLSQFVNVLYGSSYCLLDLQDKIVEYNAQPHVLSVKLDRDRLDETVYRYDTDNNDFSVSLYYNGYAEAPTNIGKYTVKASVVSKNYVGSMTFAYAFIIDKGTPTITVLPTVLGEGTYSLVAGHNTVTTDKLQGGQAAMSVNNVVVRGSFSIPDTTFTKANINYIECTFTPDDVNLYEEVVFSLPVSVIGKDSIKMNVGSGYEEKATGTTIGGGNWTQGYWDGKVYSYPVRPTFSNTAISLGTGSDCGAMICISAKNGSDTLTYGVTLSDFRLDFVAKHDDCAVCNNYVTTLRESGKLSFTDETVVPDVGGTVSVSYTLYANNTGIVDQDTLNDMTGDLSMDSILQPVYFDNTTSVELIGFIGKTLTEKRILTISDKNGKVYGVSPSGLVFDYTSAVTASDKGKEVKITQFLAQNYAFSSLPITVKLSVYTDMGSEKITAKKVSKYYDGFGISVADIVPDTMDTVVAVEQKYYSIEVRNAEGKLCEGKEIGTYAVKIILKDNKNYYYGEKTIQFTVLRKDVSEEITLSKTTDSYGSGTYDTAPKVLYGGETLTDGITVRFRKAGSDDAYVASITEAGEYDVKVVVDGTNYFGTKIFTYTVAAQTVVMKTANEERTFIVSYGSAPKNVTVSFYAEGDNAPKNFGSYVTYYTGSNYSKSTVVPTDAGSYTVTVELVDKNYRLTNNTYAYIINAKSVQIDTPPTVFSKTDGVSSYHIKYGQKVKEITFVAGTGKASGNDVEVAGTFSVAEKDADKILNAGTHEITLLFTPTDKNYATAETKVSLIVAQVEATVLFTSLQAPYNGTGRGSFLSYTVTPEIPVRVQFVSTVDGTVLNVPVQAGSYLLQVTTTDSNYTVKVTSTYAGTTPVFVVNKAQVRKVDQPTALSVSVGESLTKSSLNDGKIFYDGFNNAVEGTFRYVSMDAFSTTGTYMVQYVFTPTSTNNFDLYYGTVPITVNKGEATLTVSENSMTYGTGVDFTKLSFATKPAGLPVQFSTEYRGTTYKNGDILEAGVYYFTCWVDSENYASDVLEFAYTVKKKDIDINFVDSRGEVATAFTVLYAKQVSFSYKLYDANDLSGKRTYLLRDADTVYKNVQYTFTAKETENFTYESNNAPTRLGSYYLTATLIHANYTATVTATYKVVKGTVESITFDTDSLLKQVYGAVSAPIIMTVPGDISYYVIYQGYDRTMPTDVGSYNITVYVDDESYNATQISAVFRINAKKVSVTDLKATDRVYNGTTTVDVSGKLSGVLFGDEVQLSMTAKTADDSSSVGKHLVTVTEYRMTGLKAGNYELEEPVCDVSVSIYNNVVREEDGNSYITCVDGFVDGTAITFKTVDADSNKTSFFTKVIGVESVIMEYNITLNGEATIVGNQYKICVEIPEEYRNIEFDVEMAGALSSQSISYTREGNYITFYASTSSGRVVFNKAQFKYTVVVLVVAVVLIIVGIVALIVLNPLIHRRKLGDRYAEKKAVRKIKKG